MIRHRLSLRKVHYERRGNINNKLIDRYLNEIVEAVIQYGADKIINMDETHVQTWNLLDKVAAVKGIETVRVDHKYYNNIDGTTFVAAVSMDPEKKFPISVISKGKTKRCQKKYQVNEKEMFISNSLILIQYQ